MAARDTWRALEPVHGMIYFAPEAIAAYKALGLSYHAGYFASRSAGLGTVPASVVIATFYNFNPRLVQDSITAAWAATDPASALSIRLDSADKVLRRVLGDAVDSAEMARAADMLREAAESVTADVVGRPLYAAHAALPWPTSPHMVLWHAQTLLREYRGDGHVAALLTAGLSGIEALITHAATGAVPAEKLRTTRGWSEADWQQGVTALQERDWLTDEGAFTPTGQARRAEVERATDANSTKPYDHLGEVRCAELRELARPWSRALAEALMPWLLAGRP